MDKKDSESSRKTEISGGDIKSDGDFVAGDKHVYSSAPRSDRQILIALIGAGAVILAAFITGIFYMLAQQPNLAERATPVSIVSTPAQIQTGSTPEPTTTSAPLPTPSVPIGTAPFAPTDIAAVPPFTETSGSTATSTLIPAPPTTALSSATKARTAQAAPNLTEDCVGEKDGAKHALLFKPGCWKVIEPGVHGDVFKPLFSGGDVGGIEATGTGGGTYVAGGLHTDKQRGLPCVSFEALEMDMALDKVKGPMYMLVQSGWSTQNGDARISTGLGVDETNPSVRLWWIPPPSEGPELIPQDVSIPNKKSHKLRLEWRNQQVNIFVDGERRFTNVTMATEGYPEWFRINAEYFGSGEMSARVGSVVVTCHD